jgi:DNA processing protein
LELGRVVMAVPGPVTSMASSGTNRLLHEQVARAVSDSVEVASLLTGAGVAADPAAGIGEGETVDAAEAAEAARLRGLPDEARAVLEALSRRGTRSVDSVAEGVGISPAACLAHLGLLEIVGLARRTGPGWRRCA